MKKSRILLCLILYGIGCLLLNGCGENASALPDTQVVSETATHVPEIVMPSSQNPDQTQISSKEDAFQDTSQEFTPSESSEPDSAPFSPLRDNTPYCPIPEAPGTLAEGNDVTYIDTSNQSDGYIMVKYTGSCPKVKLIIVGPNSYKCTYNLTSSEYQAFPLTAGNGTYSIGVYENIENTSYATAYSMSLEVSITDEFSPYLRPSQYVNYDTGTEAVALSSELCAAAENDLDCVSIIYNYIIENITYDHEKAEAAQSGNLSGYIAEIDASLAAGKGICLDYAAIMACMLRSQHIPTRLEVGYAANAYHAWISTYIEDIGWVNGIIQFNGESWSLMDPTFGASSGEDELREFIGDGTNYIVKYIY